MSDSRNPLNCERFPLCKHLETIVGDIPASILFLCSEELQGKGTSVCAKCTHFQVKLKPAI